MPLLWFSALLLPKTRAVRQVTVLALKNLHSKQRQEKTSEGKCKGSVGKEREVNGEFVLVHLGSWLFCFVVGFFFKCLLIQQNCKYISYSWVTVKACCLPHEKYVIWMRSIHFRGNVMFEEAGRMDVSVLWKLLSLLDFLANFKIAEEPKKGRCPSQQTYPRQSWLAFAKGKRIQLFHLPT